MNEHLWIAYRQEFLPFNAAITRWTCPRCHTEATSWAERSTYDTAGCPPEVTA